MKNVYMILVIFLYLLSCGKAQYSAPDLGGLYSQSARRLHDQGNAVIGPLN